MEETLDVISAEKEEYCNTRYRDMSSVFNSDDEYSSSEEENIVHIDVDCPSRLNSFIIGVKGTKITPIRQEYPDVRIDIGDMPDYIQVKGPESKVEQVKNKLENMIKEGLQKYQIYNIDISQDMKNYLLEKSGCHINRLRQETGVAINISETLEQCTIKMEGNEDGLEKARKMITTIIEQLDLLGDYVEEEVIIEKRYHGALIGHQAITLREIMNMFKGVQIRFPEKDCISDSIKIQGPKKMVNQCNLHLLQLVEIRKKSIHNTKTQDVNKSAQGENINTLDFTIPPNKMSEHLEPEHLRKLFVGGLNYSTTDDSLRAYFEQFGKVVDAVAIKDSHTKKPRGFGFVAFSNSTMVDEAQSRRPHIIDGRSVETKRVFPKDDVGKPRSSFQITKTQDENKSAQFEMINTLDDDQSVSQVEIPAPKWMNRYLIGQNGSNINKITEEYPLLQIHFKDDSSGGIILEGPTDNVDAAAKKMNMEIANLLKRNEKETLIMDIKFMKHIIGIQGCNINHVREESGALINIDEIDEMCCVTLQGTQGSINSAKEAIEDLKNSAKMIESSDNIEECDVRVKKCCYDNILGTQGHNLNAVKVMFNKIKIELIDKGHNAYIIQLRGPKEDINQCENHLQSIIQECESSRIQRFSSTTSINSEVSSWSSQQNLNAGSCLEHSENVLNLRCVTHKAWICSDCCEEDHPRNYCKIITFDEELAIRKVKEEQRLYEETKKVSDTISSLIELGDKKEQERNSNIQALKEMQEAIENMKSDISQLENEMLLISQILPEGQQLQQKLNKNKDLISSATSISELSSITKLNSTYLTESKNWYEKCKKDN